MAKILIMGTMPSPIGGVSIHVERLLKHLDYIKYPYNFIDIKRDRYPKVFLLFWKSKWIHLHTSNVYVRFFYTFLGKILRKSVIITIHGNLGRFNRFKNCLDNLAIFFATIPIVVNKDSLQKAKKINKRSILVTAFIPPFPKENIKPEIQETSFKFRNFYKNIFCTNAYNVSFDKNGHEIYQITSLIKIFNELKQQLLIISDPSGEYKKYVTKINYEIGTNIFFIDEPHSFYEILKLSDVFLRITTTDGDSVSLREAIYLRKNVIATNVVDRPEGICVVDNNFTSIKNVIEAFVPHAFAKKKINNAAEILVKLYKKNI